MDLLRKKVNLNTTDKVLIVGSSISLIIIITIGLLTGRPVVFDSWNVDKVNYFMMKTSELSAGFIISALFYYLLVVIPDKRKYKTVQTRIRKLIESSQTDQNRVINNLIRKTGYGKSYEELNKEDFELILVKMDEIIIEDKEEFTRIFNHWYDYTLRVENYLTKALMYYKERLSEEALVHIEDSLEALYLRDMKSLPRTIKYWDSTFKLGYMSDDMFNFDKKIRDIHKLI